MSLALGGLGISNLTMGYGTRMSISSEHEYKSPGGKSTSQIRIRFIMPSHQAPHEVLKHNSQSKSRRSSPLPFVRSKIQSNPLLLHPLRE